MHRMLSKNLNIHQRYVHMHALRADSRTQAFEQTTMRRTANTSSMYASIPSPSKLSMTSSAEIGQWYDSAELPVSPIRRPLTKTFERDNLDSRRMAQAPIIGVEAPMPSHLSSHPLGRPF